MHLLLCFALKEEAALFRKIAADKPDVAIIVTGVGRKNAEESVRGFLAGRSGGASVPASRSPFLTIAHRLHGADPRFARLPRHQPDFEPRAVIYPLPLIRQELVEWRNDFLFARHR